MLAAGFGTGVMPQYTADNKLVYPTQYREWVFLSSGLAMNYGPAASMATPDHPMFDNVFVNRGAYAAFLQTGSWPDKTMLVLEIRSSESKGSINTSGHYQSGVMGVEVEVKDQSRGNWKFYGFEGGTSPAPAIPSTASCYSCHAKNGVVDNTFVQFYPTLLTIAKQKGTVKTPAE